MRGLKKMVGTTLAVALSVMVASGLSQGVTTPWKAGQPTFSAPTTTPAIVGVTYHPNWSTYDTATRGKILDTYASAGVTHVRIDVSWARLERTNKNVYDLWEVAQMDTRMAELNARGMKAVIMLWGAPKWASGKEDPQYPGFGLLAAPPTTASDYGDALAWVANRWSGTLDGVEMWNEPDQVDFWTSGKVGETKTDRAVSYAKLVKGAYPVAKKLAPNARFILAAPAGVGLADGWFSTLYANGVAGKYDALAVHPYVQPSNVDPTTLDVNNDWGVKAVSRVAAMMAANGDGAKKIWATEYGYSTHPNTGGEANWNLGVSEKSQADFLLKELNLLGAIPQVQAAYAYTDRDIASGVNAQQANYGLLRTDLSPKPGFFALKCAASRICGPVQLTPPTNVKTVAVNASSVRVSWMGVPGASSYQVLRNGTKVATVSATSWTNTGLVKNKTYTYTVRGTTPTLVGPLSTPVSIVLRSALAPSAPNVSKTSKTSVSLKWVQTNSFKAPLIGYTIALRSSTDGGQTFSAWTQVWHNTSNVRTSTVYTGPNTGTRVAGLYQLRTGVTYQVCIRQQSTVGQSSYSPISQFRL